MLRRLAFICCLWLPLVHLTGCSRGKVPSVLGEPGPVAGTVTLPDGKPLEKGSVAFFPLEPGQGQESFGMVDSNGNFATKVAPGKYRVSIEPEWVREASKPGESPIPEKYRNPDSSQLEFEIPKGGLNSLAIRLD
ncbi:MAG: carboxypeptidase-like regulatory domain-containing protein [Planctomycetes bacterium]|nr:carboxypeptidase-like regulatory domain-containing protein [Planctomycetota bacterium]